MERNLDAYAIYVHGIKGSSYAIFALQVGDAAEALEAAAKDGDMKTVEAGHFPFVVMTEALVGEIALALDRIDMETGKPTAGEPDQALLQELREACGAYQMDKVDAVMEQLEASKYKRGGELIAFLRGKVDAMEFEDIAGMEFSAV